MRNRTLNNSHLHQYIGSLKSDPTGQNVWIKLHRFHNQGAFYLDAHLRCRICEKPHYSCGRIQWNCGQLSQTVYTASSSPLLLYLHSFSVSLCLINDPHSSKCHAISIFVVFWRHVTHACLEAQSEHHEHRGSSLGPKELTELLISRHQSKADRIKLERWKSINHKISHMGTPIKKSF